MGCIQSKTHKQDNKYKKEKIIENNEDNKNQDEHYEMNKELKNNYNSLEDPIFHMYKNKLEIEKNI